MALDYTLIFAEPYDPCAALSLLRPAYMELLGGGAITKITFRDRTVEYSKADLEGLADILRQLESDCAASTGKRRNFAITAGGGRSCGLGGPFRR